MTRICLFIALLLTTAAATGAADTEAPPWYDVEVLVFKNNTPPGAADEVWPVDPGYPDLARATELVPPPGLNPLPGDTQPFQQLGDTSLTLTAAAARLTSSRDYAPLLHLAWRQPVTAQTDTPAVHVSSEATAGVAPALDGAIRVSRSRFLHIDVDLLYREPGAAGAGTTAELFRLQQTRRINSGEVHYFDHPVFGVLVKLTPYEPPGQKDTSGQPR
jgi:hypothetical protein